MEPIHKANLYCRSSVKPVDQMLPDYYHHHDSIHPTIMRAHDLFHRRMAFENVNLPSFDMLLSTLQEAHILAPNDPLITYELAYVLAQYQPNYHSLQQACSLLQYAHIASDHPLHLRAARLQGLINVMLTRGRQSLAPTIPHRINWSVNNRCPMVCIGCYNTFSPYQLTLDECKMIVQKTKKAGISFITLSGGDPLLWPDLYDLLDYLRQQDICIGIDTTGYTLNEAAIKKLKGAVSYIGLPLDGSDDQSQKVFRKAPVSVFHQTQEVLRLCQKHQVHVKINTVTHRQNFHHLEAIGNILSQYTCIQDWSIFQWWPLRATDDLCGKMAIDLDSFKRVTSRLPDQFPNLRIRIRSIQSRSLTHLFIQNSGLVTTFGSYSQEEIILGHILRDEFTDILKSPAIRCDSPKFREVERFQVDAAGTSSERIF